MMKLLKIPIVTLITCLLFCYLGNTELSAQNAKQQCEDAVSEATDHTTTTKRCKLSTTYNMPDLIEGGEKLITSKGKAVGKIIKVHMNAEGQRIFTLSKAYIAQLSTKKQQELKANPSYLIEE